MTVHDCVHVLMTVFMCSCVHVFMCWCVDMLMFWCVNVLMCPCADVLRWIGVNHTTSTPIFNLNCYAYSLLHPLTWFLRSDVTWISPGKYEKDLQPHWQNSPKVLESTIEILEIITNLYKNHSAVGGINLINEPWLSIDINLLKVRFVMQRANLFQSTPSTAKGAPREKYVLTFCSSDIYEWFLASFESFDADGSNEIFSEKSVMNLER